MPKMYRKMMLKGSQNDAKMDAKIMIFSNFSRKGDFAEMCTAIERELGCEGLGVPKIEEKSKKNDAKMMLEKVMQK